ncbi:spore germination protein [Pseudobacteroides cellulosolvens]|uniref:GerA spore germination protein n=1 Tax=Pseudobacteroides cellulosolvens ATCC 35603 = DSM 2933 TaxID=398512 RepID=A0A0L6JN27_9FIRM|nr:spore germination protein [Pseudobacteroides cellulosolvens]KNY27191.1 GerA spore germination protein [Pseudobacteroides cellulosolvens ATCC 35603 = DSM 2933]
MHWKKNKSDNAETPKETKGIDVKLIIDKLKDCPDIVQKKVFLDSKYEAYFIYIGNMVNKDLLQRDFMRPVLSMGFKELSNRSMVLNLPCYEITLLNNSDEVVENIMSGNSVFVSDSIGFALSYTASDMAERSIDEPVTEKNVRGPHEGFVEPLSTNLSILRRKIKNNKLKFKTVTLGIQTNQKVAVTYIEDIANIDMVNSIYNKISNIKIDGLSSIGNLEQLIIPHPFSLFPQFLATERPDRVMAALLEGSVVIIMDGTPVTLVAPVDFISFFQAPDDYSTSWIHGSFLRLLRIIGLILAVILPSLYIGVTTFHYYVAPLNLLIFLAESRSKVPFPPIVEVLILEILVEMIREAAVRLPTYIGTVIGVFASLVIGQAAVEAGIVSNVLIVIVGASAVASYVIPSFDMSMSIRILRFIFTLAASFFGFIGIVICTGFTLVHLVSMQSLGQPYFQPFAPLVVKDLKDTIFRLPLKAMGKRTTITKTKNQTRGRKNGRE